jgi:hypothetical protein
VQPGAMACGTQIYVNTMTKEKIIYQIVWGVLLVLMGIGVFFRIPQVMPRIEQIEYFSSVIWFVRFSFYLIGILLIGGGIKKIISCYRKLTNNAST